MKPILRASFGLAALLAGCHRDLDVPECAHDANGCGEQDAPAETAVDSSEPIDSAVVTDTEPDGTIEDTADAVVGDVTDTATDTLPDVGADACASMTCTTPPAATCASTTTRRTYAATGTCSAGACSYAQTDTACPAGETCSGGVCSPPSCAGGLSCGGASCCESRSVAGGTFPMGRATTGAEADACAGWASPCHSSEQPEHNAAVAGFRLDTFEVTVGRFRKFVAAYPGSKPPPGAGAHPLISGSGWNAAWNGNLPLSAVDLMSAVKCESSLQTWTDSVGANENKPINCVDWYTAFAFCAWDGGRLPTEAEWEYAAAGGTDNRVLPWGNTAPSTTLVNYGCAFSCTLSDIPAVGSSPLGAGRWGQKDLAGSVAEWTLDWFNSYTSASVTNYAQMSTSGTTGMEHVSRGGSFMHMDRHFRAVARFEVPAGERYEYDGFRCARTP